MKKIYVSIIILGLIIFFSLTKSNAAYYGFFKTGIRVEQNTNSNFDFIPYINVYMLNNIRQGTSTRMRLGFNRNIEDKDEFDIYSIDDFYVYMNNYNYRLAKNWYFYLGDKKRAYSPITMWGSKLRGVSGGIILNSGSNDIFNSFEINGFWGYTKQKIKGFESDNIEQNRNGQFLQGNYGCGVSFNIGENIKMDGLYSFFQDDKNSLKTNEDYQTKPIKNQIISGKIGYYDNKNRIYFNYAQSKYNSDIANNSADDVTGNAFYVEGDGYINDDIHLNGSVKYIDDKYMSVAVTSFVNDIMKFYSGIDWRGRMSSVSADGYYKVNNVNNNDNVLTTGEYGASIGGSFNFTKTFLFSTKIAYKKAESKKEVDDSFDNWNMYEIGADVSKLFNFGSIFKTLKLTLTAKYSKKDDNSVVKGVNAVNQELLSGGIISSLDLYTIANDFQIIVYNLKSSVTENFITGLEKFSYNIIRNKWLNFIQYNIIADYQNSSKVYVKNTIWYGNEIYLGYKNSLKFNIGYEVFDSNSNSFNSYKSAKCKLEYQYTF